MRAFAWFFGLVFACLLLMGAIAYPSWVLLHPYFDFPFHRIASRVGQLTLFIGLYFVARHLGVANKQSFGYGLPWRRFIPAMLKALAIGVATMAPIAVVMGLMGLRVWKNGVTPDFALFAGTALQGLGTGLAVALIEETFLRGAMFTAVSRESGIKAAIFLTSLLYAAAHFLARTKIPPDQVHWYSGVDLLLGTLRMFGEPLRYADAFLCLFGVGVLLASVRAVTGNIASCMGLHAGWVWVITFMREGSEPNDAHPLRFLVSEFDGVVGWLVLAWTVLIGLVIYKFYARRSDAVSLQPGG
ncbi:MAG: CPBP family intramembrane glutamic endopeptidase [Gammaproteobacteria bacterium]